MNVLLPTRTQERLGEGWWHPDHPKSHSFGPPKHALTARSSALKACWTAATLFVAAPFVFWPSRAVANNVAMDSPNPVNTSETLLGTIAKGLSSDDTLDVMQACRKVVILGQKAAPLVDELVACLSRDDDLVKGSAIQALEHVGPLAAQAIELLRVIAENGQERGYIRYLAWEAILAIDPDGEYADAIFLHFLESKDPDLQTLALLHASTITTLSSKVKGLLFKVAEDSSDPESQYLVCCALRLHGLRDPEVHEFLLRLSQTPAGRNVHCVSKYLEDRAPLRFYYLEMTPALTERLKYVLLVVPLLFLLVLHRRRTTVRRRRMGGGENEFRGRS